MDVPDCPTKQPDGSTKVVPGTEDVRFNTSLGQDGRDAGCTMRTVKEVTGIEPDHFMMADFNAVKTLTTGGRRCRGVPQARRGRPRLAPEAVRRLAQDRGRAGAGVRPHPAQLRQPGDLDRIKVQQQFLSSLMRKMASSDTLTNPAKLYDLADAATKALTVDKGISKVNTLKDMALELKKVPTKNITFLTVPVLDNPADGPPVHKTVIIDPTRRPPSSPPSRTTSPSPR